MGQQEVIDFLKKNPDEWFTAVEMNLAGVPVKPLNIRIAARKLVKYNEIKCKETSNGRTYKIVT